MTILSNITLFLIGWVIGFIVMQVSIELYRKHKRKRRELQLYMNPFIRIEKSNNGYTAMYCETDIEENYLCDIPVKQPNSFYFWHASSRSKDWKNELYAYEKYKQTSRQTQAEISMFIKLHHNR
jgi:hypothetical protein